MWDNNMKILNIGPGTQHISTKFTFYCNIKLQTDLMEEKMQTESQI